MDPTVIFTRARRFANTLTTVANTLTTVANTLTTVANTLTTIANTLTTVANTFGRTTITNSPRYAKLDHMCKA